MTTAVKNNTIPTDKEKDNIYKIRPDIKEKFRPALVKDMIQEVLQEYLSGKEYNTEESSLWCREISDAIKARLKEMDFSRYKFVVQCVIGEQKGEGVKMGCRCFWDSDADNYAQDIFSNESLFCVAAAFGLYYY